MATDKPVLFYKINPKVGVVHKVKGGSNYRLFGPVKVSLYPLNL